MSKYCWYNLTLNKPFYYEDKELLNYQRNEKDHKCVNVESYVRISKKQMRKPNKALDKRLHNNIN